MILDQLFERIEKQFDDKLPFVAYRKPNASEVKGMFQRDDKLHYMTDFTESGFLIAPFDSKDDSYLIPLNQSEVISVQFDPNNFSEHGINFQKKSSDSNNVNQEADRSSHIKRVENAIEAIKTDSFSKVVLSRREIIKNVEPDTIEIFKRLLQRYPTAFVYVWYHPKVGLWLGATPETLLSMIGNQLKTMSLAGTQAYEGSINVIWKEKEKEEQQIVTDFIVDNLQTSISNQLSEINSFQASNGDINISGPNTVKAGNLLHLQTEISMHLRPETRNLKPILDALHPTPAVCGFPKQRAKAYIVENEGYPREFYAGFIGELNLKETTSRNTNRRNVENNAYRVQKSVSDLYVNLRCMQIKDQNILIYVGGGITKDSNPEAEWMETVHKSKTIKSVL